MTRRKRRNVGIYEDRNRRITIKGKWEEWEEGEE